MQPTMRLNRGSDLQFAGFWPSAPGSMQGMNLTGYTIDVYQPHPALAGHITLTVTSATDGTFAGVIEWQDDMPVGAIMSFQVRIVQGGVSLTTPAITVLVEQ